MNILKAVNLRKIYGQGETEVKALDGVIILIAGFPAPRFDQQSVPLQIGRRKISVQVFIFPHHHHLSALCHPILQNDIDIGSIHRKIKRHGHQSQHTKQNQQPG